MTDDTGDEGRAPKGPDAFRTISEVAEELGLPQHVLRFWETRFAQIKPIKRGGGRRYYRPHDVDLLRSVKQLLYGEGYTIRGVQKLLREQGARRVAERAPAPPPAEAEASPAPPPAPSGGVAGPEAWAPQRGRAPGSDPEDAEPPYPADWGAADRMDRGPAPIAGLSDDQRRRLVSALSELRACRRLIDERL